MKKLSYVLLAALLLTGCGSHQIAEPEETRHIIFGIDADRYTLEHHKVEIGDTWGRIFEQYGIGGAQLSEIDMKAKDICPLNQIRLGNKYMTFIKDDSLDTHLDYLVYQKNLVEYVVFGFVNDSITVTQGSREVTLKRQKRSATIDSSLWGAIISERLPFSLAAEMEEIYQWTIDFFGIQAGDSFTVIYDEKFIDTVSIGIGKVWGAKFHHMGKDVYAIPFPQGGKVQYWEYDGGSLRKQLLKAPLKFTRISSKFSNARYHPVLHVYKPHHGVDYAAPSGTPVRSVDDGTVISKGFQGAAGNMLKIKHPGNLTSGYMHLKTFAKGIAVGKRVQQGQVIGYVGSTGRSTGPHLDFRIWKGSTPINPLKIPQQPSEPISKDNREKFEWVRDRIVAELEGDVADSMRIIQLDSIIIN